MSDNNACKAGKRANGKTQKVWFQRGPVEENKIANILKEMGKIVGKNIVRHTLRKTNISEKQKAGINGNVIAKMLDMHDLKRLWHTPILPLNKRRKYTKPLTLLTAKKSKGVKGNMKKKKKRKKKVKKPAPANNKGKRPARESLEDKKI